MKFKNETGETISRRYGAIGPESIHVSVNAGDYIELDEIVGKTLGLTPTIPKAVTKPAITTKKKPSTTISRRKKKTY